MSVCVCVSVCLSLLLLCAVFAISSICACWKQLRGVLMSSGKMSGGMEGAGFFLSSEK